MSNRINQPSYDQLICITDCSDSGIHLVDKNGITIYYNKSAENIDGIKSEDIIGKNMYDLVEDGTFSKSVALESLKSKKETQLYQIVNSKYVFAKGVPIFDKDELEYIIVYTRDLDTLRILNQQLNEIREENIKMATSLSKYESKYTLENQLVHNNKKMDKIVKLAKRVSSLDSPVLITGEPGTGKTMFAHYLHDVSGRINEPFVKFDCAAIPQSIMEEELLGKELVDKNGNIVELVKGVLQKADGGTIFIDEIADMPISIQSKLIEVIDNCAVVPIGSNRMIGINIRVIAASNENLKKLVEKGKFRGDLYYKLAVIPLNIPALRNRKEDIMPLIQIFLEKFNNFYDLKKGITPDARRALMDYYWPGNVRELENIIERLVVTCEGDVTYNDVIDNIQIENIEYSEATTYKDKIDQYEKSLILYYSSISSSIKEMAEKANINESTLRKKIDRLDIILD